MIRKMSSRAEKIRTKKGIDNRERDEETYARLLVLLFVTKNIFLFAFLSLSRVSGIPSIKESPLQMTPSQSNMKTSTVSRSSFWGSLNFNTLAARGFVVREKGRLDPPVRKLAAVDDWRTVNAEVLASNVASIAVVLAANFIVQVSLFVLRFLANDNMS